MALRFVLEPVLKEKGMTPEKLSEVTGVSLETIASMCDGSLIDFSLKELDAICEALDCDIPEIIKSMKGDWHFIDPKTGETTPTNALDI